MGAKIINSLEKQKGTAKSIRLPEGLPRALGGHREGRLVCPRALAEEAQM